MRTIIQYDIVRGESRHALTKNVNLALSSGFEPHASPVIDQSGIWHQAMVKYSQKTDAQTP